MSDNELLKQINREIKMTSLENTEKKSVKIKDESEKDQDEKLDDYEKEDENDSIDEKEKLDILNDVDNSIEDVAAEQIEDIKKDKAEFVLSSSPELLDEWDFPLERNEIVSVDASGILKDYKSDNTADFIDPDTNNKENILKVVDTALGVFTILNYDEKNVLLLDSNKQKIQISISDFNNLHPFEIKDKVLSDVNSFSDACLKDIKNKENHEKEKETDEKENNIESEDELEVTTEEEPTNGGFGESVKKRILKKEETKSKKNLISEIQKGLSKKDGVVETIRSDVRGKNRCILLAKKTKATKDIHMNETKPKCSNVVIKPYKSKNNNQLSVLESRKKKEATQVSDIAQAPRGIFTDDEDFDMNNVMTLKDGKYVLAKIEGTKKTAYLRLLPKKNISINELKFILNDCKSFSESLNIITNKFTLVEKEVVTMESKKCEKEKIETEDLEEVEVESETDEEKDFEDSIPFSVEINGVRYSGTLYAEEEEDSEDEESDDDDDDEESDDDEEDSSDEDDEDYSDLLLQSEDDIDELVLPSELDDENIEAEVKLDNVNYKVKFNNVKEDCIKRAKIEMSKHNKVGAWNALVRGAKHIEA